MNPVFSIEVPENQPAYAPRQTLVGTLRWQRQRPFTDIHLALYWYTQGVGDMDSEVVETLEWNNQPASGERFFEILLPRAPYSITSENLSIHWKLEVTGKPGKDRADFDLIIAPGAKIIDLKTVTPAAGGMDKFKSWLGVNA